MFQISIVSLPFAWLSSGCWKLQYIRLNGSLLDWEPLWEKKEKMSVTERMGTAQKDSESIALESERVKIVWETKEVEKYGFKLVCLYRPFPHKAWLLLSKMDFQWQCIRYCIKRGTLCYPAAKNLYISQSAESLLHSSRAFHNAACYFVRSFSWLSSLVCVNCLHFSVLLSFLKSLGSFRKEVLKQAWQ